MKIRILCTLGPSSLDPEVIRQLSARDIAYVSNLSSAYALFERAGELLRPLELTPLAHYDSDLITIPKYAGP